ncbi:MAG: ferrochelatase, partial [Legionella sp. 21-45-4]
MKKGLLLINLGTPNAPSVRAVRARAYLREFLSDPRVIDLPGLIRFILLYAFILPFRPKQSAHAYQVIWTPEGSPLLTGSLALTNKVQARLADTHQVALGMRYGEPSLLQALKTLETADEIPIIPLFPHYASATTGSCLEWVSRYFSSKAIFPSLHIIRDFYQHPGFINAVSAQIKP